MPIFDQRVADIVRERSVAYYPPRSKQIPSNPPQSDFEWFASAGTDLSQFRGMHIAVYQKKVIGWGATRIEAYQMAKSSVPDSRPLMAYVAESADTIF